LANHLRKTVKISGVKAGLLREFGAFDVFKSAELLADLIKSIPITLTTSQPMERAISSAGGISIDALDENLMIKAMPGVFASGEMLNWDAPTGGYLLTACLALGKGAAEGSVKWLKKIN
jgi:predicted flavoprotein YhiN